MEFPPVPNIIMKHSNENNTINDEYRKRKKAEKDKRYYLKHKEVLKLKQKMYRESHTESVKMWQKDYRAKNKETRQKYLIENADRIKKQKNIRKINRRISDPTYRFIENLRSRVLLALKAQKSNKITKTVQLLGCSPLEAKMFIESKFKDGMTWDNHGIKGWHIDHIRPCSSFDLSDPEEQKKCFHYTNLQPLWWWENRKKSNKLSV